MTLDPAAKRLLAWQNPGFDPCTCGQTPGHRCRTTTGALCLPHKSRMDQATGWLARDAEIEQWKSEAIHWETEYDDASGQYDALTANIATLTDQLKTARLGAALVPGLQQQVADLLAKIADLEKPAPVPVPEPTPMPAPVPTPTPAPLTRLPFGIGVQEKITAAPGVPTVYTLDRLEQEAGVKFGYVHEYFRFGTSGVLTTVVAWCETHLKAGRIPVPTIKLPGDDWPGTRDGKYDGTIKATIDALEALSVKYGQPVVVITHHEPTGDGDRDTFLAMYRHLRPIVQRPGHVQYWMNLEGWAQILNPAEKVWNLDNLKVEGIDGYLFDPYLAYWQKSKNSTTFTDMVKTYLTPLAKWCKGNGFQVGIGETGMTSVAQGKASVPNDTWWADFTKGARDLGFGPVIYWNNYNPTSGNDWRISTTKPADMLSQMVAAMRAYARA